MSTLLQDFRYGLRVLLKSPGFSIIAILTLALGIGANSTIFSWINSTVLDPIPGVQHASQYVALTTGGANDPNPLSYPDYVDLRDRNHSFSEFIGSNLTSMDLTANSKPERVWGVLCTANYFSGLGVRPVLGRGFLPVEGAKPDGAPVVVISYRLWQTHFGGERSVVGSTIEINKHPYTIVGVTPPLFQGTQTGLRADMWIPVMMIGQFWPQENPLQARGDRWVMVTARLKPGVTREQAQAEMNGLMQQIARQYPDAHKGNNTVTAYPLWRGPFGANYYLDTILFLLMAISGVVLLLACANVANLLLVRSVARRREMAIRLSIGATRWRLVRQLLAESLILACCGGGIAMVFTLWTAGTLSDFIPPVAEIPISMSIRADHTVLVATLVISLLTGVIFGILPALRSSSLEPVAILKEESASAGGGRSKARLSSILVVAQIAMSLLLLVCAGLFIRSFREAQKFNPGFNPHNVLLYSYDLEGVGYDQKSGAEFDRQLFTKLQAIPGVQSATLADWVPFGFGSSSYLVQAEGYVPQPHESMDVEYADVAPDYLRTMQIPLVAGREFTVNDTSKSQLVTVVNQEFVKRYWPHQNAIGKRLHAGGKWFTVVGVAQNSDYDHIGQKPKRFLYLPLFQNYGSGVSIHVRVAGDPLGFVAPVGQAVRSLDADLPLFDLTTLDSRIQLNTVTQRMGGVFVGGFGILALVLAGIGIYGVLSYSTRQRTHEIGIRMALGAEPRDVFGLVLRQGAFLAILGLSIGLLLSLVLTRALSSQLFGVTATDPLTFAAVGILLLAVALVACYLPARRAMRTDPMVALRHE